MHAIASAVGATHLVELDNPAGSVGLAEPERGWPAMERPDLRGDAGPPAGLWHQPFVHPVQTSTSSVPARAGGLGRPAHLRRRRQGRRRLPGPGGGREQHEPLPPGECLAQPVVQEESQLPTGTSAPNTVITESALRRLHLADQNSLAGWMILTSSPITSAQLTSANSLAASADLSTESKNDAPTSAEIVNWATVFGIALALGVLAMSVGLIRSETANELRTLTATGASSRTRRSPDGGHRRWPRLPGCAARHGGGVRRSVRLVPLELAGGWGVRHHRSRPVEQPVPHCDRHADRRHGRRLGAGGTRPDGDRHPAHGVGERGHSQRRQPGDESGRLPVTE